MVIFPNAKINIGLQVQNKRKDGYHNIRSVFYPLKQLYDVLEINEYPEAKNGNISFTTSGFVIPEPKENNLCFQAYRILSSKFKLPAVKVHLHKVIPIASGFGGGSSDGSHMLKLLNTYFGLNLSSHELEEYALTLGSDCPFFIKNEPALVQGRGERLTSLNLDLSQYEIKVTIPQQRISTKEAFSYLGNMEKNIELYDLGVLENIGTWKQHIKNDFEEIIFKQYPELCGIKSNLYKEGAIYASMTGSGSGFYGIFEKKK